MSDPKQPVIQGRLVKMDGEWPEGSIPEHPETHPACSEILEFTNTSVEPTVVYRRP